MGDAMHLSQNTNESIKEVIVFSETLNHFETFVYLGKTYMLCKKF